MSLSTRPSIGNRSFIAVSSTEEFISALSLSSLSDQRVQGDFLRISLKEIDKSFNDIEGYFSHRRLYYYRIPGLGSASVDLIIQEIFDQLGEEIFRSRGYRVTGLVVSKDRIYIPLLAPQGSGGGESGWKVVAACVFRIGSPVAVIRVSEDEDLDKAEAALEDITGNRLEKPKQQELDPDFHAVFEERYIRRYSNLWIDAESETELNKVHLTASEFGDPRDSRIARELIDEQDGKKNRIVSGQATLDEGVVIYFQWVKSRTTVRSEAVSALNVVADKVRSVLVLFDRPPAVRTILNDQTPIRVESYHEYYAATWATNYSRDEFVQLCESRDIGSDAQVTFDIEGQVIGQSSWENMDEVLSIDEEINLIRVDDTPFSLVWECRGDWGIISVISDNDPYLLNDIFQQTEGKQLSEDKQDFLRDYIIGPPEEL